MEQTVLEIIRIVSTYRFLSSEYQDFGALFTQLNSPLLTLDGHRLNPGIRVYEEKLRIQPVLNQLKKKAGGFTILEIGAGSAQLASLLLEEGAKYVIMDLPSMHARGPYFLYKHANTRVCTYKQYLQLNRNLKSALKDYDVVYLPPWEKKALNHQFDLAINCHSLSEMAPEEANGYLEVVGNCCNYFFSINTNTRGLSKGIQPQEYSCLEFEEILNMEPIETGTMYYDSILHKTPHYVYATYKN